ncbi:MAG: TAT-variant-translocated molybdopterin oxidoreductase [Candidatus Hydrogenedentes bacterium]|nr:TAT-variant-translocated molybdopterin oxidoreductase [Candidatus Hydrogenedentota bacterium]
MEAPGTNAVVNTYENKRNRLDLASVRKAIAGRTGREYWQSLEELAETPTFREFMDREFPREASVMPDGVDRRAFLKVMGASLALAGLNACSRQPNEQIIPYVKPPVELVPGTPMYFATAMTQGGYAIGLLAENHMGRPTKLEGNPNHPASLGSTDIFSQASVLTLYDPDRSTVARKLGSISTWDTFAKWIDILVNGEKLADGTKISKGLRDSGGTSIRILTETVTSPTLQFQIQQLLASMPGMRWHQYEPSGRDNAARAARLAFGQLVGIQYKMDAADVVLSLGSDFLTVGPGSVRYSRDFAAKRVPGNMNRLYCVEGTPTLTGAMADHALHVRPSQIEVFARAIARKLGVDAPGPEVDEPHRKFVDAVAADLQQHAGSGIVVAGDSLSANVHILVHRINEKLGNAGKTVLYTDSIEADPQAADQTESLKALVRDMKDGKVELLIIVGGNPAYYAPADLDFSAALDKVAHRVHLGMYYDETAERCHWHLPEAHYLESWSDALAFDGTASIVQPLIAPLYNGKSAHELLAAVAGQPGNGYNILREYWQKRHGEQGFDAFWKTALAKGVVEGTTLPPKPMTVRPDIAVAAPDAASKDGLEVAFCLDSTIGDGRWANNGWLQELPKPLTKITWDNAIIVGLPLAERMNLSNFDIVEVTIDGRKVQGQIWIQPGQPDNLITLSLGYGRTMAGAVGNGTGYNAYTVRTSDKLWFAQGVELKRIGNGPEMARTEVHHLIRGQRMEALSEHGRHLVFVGTAQEYAQDPELFKRDVHLPEHEMSMFKSPEQEHQQQWGMTIDLSACTGCGVCTIACQAENNIPVVGKDQVRRGREMHWIRVDRYYQGDPANEPRAVHQPVACVQCEKAPCEVVCPVGATVHSNEGLNDMVYNRCVGTRYCSNNCPYKVRRFNFLQYSDQKTPVKQMVFNPDVTVRSRGVMEKCSYCVQRINLARIDAKKEGRKVREGEIVTACQAACPAAAIAFGDIGNPDSRVAKDRKDPRNYALLDELNTRPRTTYMAKLRNPNPELEAIPTNGSSKKPREH